MKNVQKFLIFFILVGCMSCSKPKKKTKSRDYLKICLKSDPLTLDPRKGSDISSSSVHFMLYEGLNRMGEHTTREPSLAESYEVSEDQKTYIFHLRDATWSNGSPITSYDFAYSWSEILRPDFPAPNANLLYSVKNALKVKKGELPVSALGLYTPDAKTFVVELETPTPYFLDLTAFCVLYPVNKEAAEKDPNWASLDSKHFITSGPFSLKEWKHHSHMVVEKSSTYWEKDRVKLPKIEVTFISDDTTALELYEQKQLDIIGDPYSSLPTDSISTLLKNGKLFVHPVAASSFCTMNVNRFPFTNKNIRKAFALAVDRQAIVNNITQLNEQIALDMIPAVLKNNQSDAYFQDHDLQEAKKCFQQGLKELGITKDELPEITLLYCQNNKGEAISLVLQEGWQKAFDVKVRLKNLDFKVLLDHLSKKDFSIGVGFWFAQYSDAMNIFDRFKYNANAKNYSGWENQKFIEYLDASMYAKNPEERLAILKQAEEVFVHDFPIIPLFHWNFSYMIQDYLKGYFISPVGSVHFQYAHLEDAPKQKHI